MFVSARRPVFLATSFGLLSAACPSPQQGTVLIPDGKDAGHADATVIFPDATIGQPDASAGEPDAEVRDSGEELDLRERLLMIEGLDVEEIFAPLTGTRAFLLKLRQPEDHHDPRSPTFKQRLVLVHHNETAPLVLATTGYGLFGDPEVWTQYLVEPAAALDANQLVVEHRFFGESIAREPRWQYLNIEQSANDSHRIVELLSEIYTGPRVGTGVSKGGMTAIFHHRFFPDDLDAIVPYVAPISFGIPDSRYLEWVSRIGPADGVCRGRVRDMAIELIERRVEVADYFITNDPAAGAFRREVVEAMVTFPAFGWHWSFWQGYGSAEACAALPPRDASIEGLAAWFPFYPGYIFDTGFDPEVSPYGYQVSNELGTPDIDDSYIWTVASEVDYSVLPQVPPEPTPWGSEPMFNERAMFEVDDFLRQEARHVLGIYGEWDPWTGGIITVDQNNDSAVFRVPAIGHGAQISLLPENEQADALALLNAWIGRTMLVAPDWSSARARMIEHRAGHEYLVSRALEADLRVADQVRRRRR